MKCKKCGNEIKSNEKKCNKCGTPVARSVSVKNVPATEKPAGAGGKPAVQAETRSDHTLSKISFFGAIVAIASFFSINWLRFAPSSGFSLFKGVLADLNFAALGDLFRIQPTLGIAAVFLLIFAWLLWLVPLTGFASVVVFFNKRKALKLLRIMLCIAMAVLLVFTVMLFVFAGSLLPGLADKMVMQFAFIRKGYYLCWLGLIWLLVSVSVDLHETRRKEAGLAGSGCRVCALLKKVEFPATKVSIGAGIVLIVSWFLFTWHGGEGLTGLGYFISRLATYNPVNIVRAFEFTGFFGVTFTVASILFYSLWLIPIAGGLTFLVFANDRKLIRVINVFAWIGFACVLGYSFFRFWYHAQMQIMITPAGFSWGYIVSLFLLLWIAVSTKADLKRTEKQL